LDDFANEFDVEDVSVAKASESLISHGLPIQDEEYFARPIVIATASWSDASAEIAASILPWSLWVNNPMVAARMKGKSYWRGRLCLRFDLAASPYHYGFMRINMRLLRGLMTFGGIDTGKSRSSQMIGVDIDASVPGGKILELPWCLQRGVATVCLTDTLLGSAGTLFYHVLAPLARSDAASSGTATIVTRAWIEDFRSYGATRRTVVAQSSVVRSEIGKGVVSRFSVPMERAAKALSSVPFLGGAAGAGGKALGVANEMLGLFGLSRPRDSGTTSATHQSIASWARTDVPSSAVSSSFTNSQTVSLSTAELDERETDDMVLSVIFGRESLLTSFPWTTSDARDSELFTLAVNPTLALTTTYGGTGGTYWDPTSLAYGSLPFRFWRGSIKYRIRVCCSKFHSGVLRVVYDPARQGGNPTDDTTWALSNMENCQMSISPGCELDLVVNWSSNEFWRPLDSIFRPSESASSNAQHTNSNGSLRFFVESPLLAPLSSAGITVLVWVSGGDDYEVFGVKEDIPTYGTGVAPNPGIVAPLPPPPVEEGSPQSSIVANGPCVTRCVFGGLGGVAPQLNDRTFGEKIVSLRPLLKRYAALGTFTPVSDGSPSVILQKSLVVTTTLYPPTYGVSAGAGNQITYTPSCPTLFRWFRAGYMGARGGMRFRVTDAGIIRNEIGSEASYNDFMSSCGPCFGVTGGTAALQIPLGGFSNVQYGGLGIECVSSNFGQYADYEVPDYNRRLFRVAGPGGGIVSSADGSVTGVESDVVFVLSKTAQDAKKITFYVSYAAADDFSFLRWLGAPCCYDGG